MVAHISCDVVKLVRGLSLAGDSIRVETWRGGGERNTHQLTTCTTNGYDKERIQTDRIQIDRIQTDRQTDKSQSYQIWPQQHVCNPISLDYLFFFGDDASSEKNQIKGKMK